MDFNEKANRKINLVNRVLLGMGYNRLEPPKISAFRPGCFVCSSYILGIYNDGVHWFWVDVKEEDIGRNMDHHGPLEFDMVMLRGMLNDIDREEVERGETQSTS